MTTLSIEQLHGVVEAECEYEGRREPFVYYGWRGCICAVEPLTDGVMLRFAERDSRPAYELRTHDGWQPRAVSIDAPFVMGPLKGWDVVSDADGELIVRNNNSCFFDPRPDSNERTVSRITFRRATATV